MQSIYLSNLQLTTTNYNLLVNSKSEIYFFGDIYSLLLFILLSSFILVYIFSFTESYIVFTVFIRFSQKSWVNSENGLQFRVIYKLLISVPVTSLNCSLAEAFFENIFFSHGCKAKQRLVH